MVRKICSECGLSKDAEKGFFKKHIICKDCLRISRHAHRPVLSICRHCQKIYEAQRQGKGKYCSDVCRIRDGNFGLRERIVFKKKEK